MAGEGHAPDDRLEEEAVHSAGRGDIGNSESYCTGGLSFLESATRVQDATGALARDMCADATRAQTGRPTPLGRLFPDNVRSGIPFQRFSLLVHRDQSDLQSRSLQLPIHIQRDPM